MKTLPSLFEKFLVAVIAMVLLAPLALTLTIRRLEVAPTWAKWLGHEWLRNQSLSGVTVQPPPAVPFSSKALRAATYQESVAVRFNRSFAGRECLIRLTSEAYFRLFRVAVLRSTTAIVGRDDWLFEKAYLDEYAVKRPAKEDLEPLVHGLALLQEECRKRGILFALVITPSKAAIFPEKVPSAWEKRFDSRRRGYSYFKELLDEQKVSYVDGPALTARARANAPVPLFSKGGVHWGDYAAFLSANELIANLRQQGFDLRPIEAEAFRISTDPKGIDADVCNVMNLVTVWHYPFGEVVIRPPPWRDPSTRPNLALIGDSFGWGLAAVLGSSRQWSEVDMYFYTKLQKICYVDGLSSVVAEPVGHIDFRREIFAADGLVLELNEANVARGNHLMPFVTQALVNASKASPEKASFLAESWMPYRWGQKIGFNSIQSVYLSRYRYGFSKPEIGMSWTKGPEAMIRLEASPPDQDLILEAELGAFMPPGGKDQEVTVRVNDQPIGTWSFHSPAVQKRQLRIPQELAATGKLVLCFQIAHPTNPRAVGLGLAKDDRQLGLCFSKLEIRPMGPPLPESFMPYLWGQEISFRAGSPQLAASQFLSGFSGPEAEATWTEGTEAIVRLDVPPADAAVILEAELSGFFSAQQVAQRTTVFVNDKPVGEWVVAWARETKQMVIPRALIGPGGKMTLRFQISHPSSPAENGMKGDDHRKLGLCFSKLRLRSSAPSAARLAGP